MPKQKKYTDGDRVLIKYDENAYYMAVVTNVLAKSIDVVYDSDESEERVRIDSPRIFGSPVNNRRNANEIPEARAYKLCDIANPNARAPRSNGDATNATAATGKTGTFDFNVDRETWAATFKGKAIGELRYVDGTGEDTEFRLKLNKDLPKKVKAAKPVLKDLRGRQVAAFIRKVQGVLDEAA